MCDHRDSKGMKFGYSGIKLCNRGMRVHGRQRLCMDALQTKLYPYGFFLIEIGEEF